MKTPLFPHSFQAIGWILFVPTLILGTLIFFSVLSFRGVLETITTDISIIGIAVGALFIVCSKERIEDEMTRYIRLTSLLKSIYVYVLLLVACTVFINGVDFLVFTIVNLVLLPIIFVCNFRLEIYRYHRLNRDEEQN